MVEELDKDAVEERQGALGETIECSTGQSGEIKAFGPVDSGLLHDRVGEKRMTPGRKNEKIAKRDRWTV